MEGLEEQISMQLPETMTLSDLLTDNVMDDLSKDPPHMQDRNINWMTKNAMLLKSNMLSGSEGRHSLTVDGEVQKGCLETYLQRDQKIRELIAALVATTTSVCIRAFQFKLIQVGSDEMHQRNIWLLDGRFLLRKLAAKQRSINFADTLFWLPRKVTRPLSVFFYFQQPFIYGVLGTQHRQYAVHLWPLLPAKSETQSGALSLWSGANINKAVRKCTKKISDIPLDCQAIRQLAEGFLREKVPFLWEPFFTPHNCPPSGTYHIDSVLKQYSSHWGLDLLVGPTEMEKSKVAAVLLVSDIWQGLINVEEKSNVWLHLATEMLISPAAVHKDLAYAKAQHLKKLTLFDNAIDLTSLTQGLKLLENPDFSSFKVCCIEIKISTSTYLIRSTLMNLCIRWNSNVQIY